MRLWRTANDNQAFEFWSSNHGSFTSRGAVIRYYKRNKKLWPGHDYVIVVPEHRREKKISQKD